MGPLTDEQIDRLKIQIAATELGPWPPDSSRLESAGRLLGERLEKVSELSEEEARSAIDGAVEEASAVLFEGDHGEQTAQRFDQQAFVLLESKREDAARDCLAAAAAIRNTPGSENPIVRALTEACLAPVLERAVAAKDAVEGLDPSADS